MDIDRAQVEIRSRTSWEATDLGFALARRWWWTCTGGLLLTAGPVFILLNLLFGGGSEWGAVAFWWLKPLFERVPLTVISRGFFGEEGAPFAMVKKVSWPSIRELLLDLLLRRLSPVRSFLAPVQQLEGQHGRNRERRVGELMRADSGTAVMMTIGGAAIELALSLSVVALVVMLSPADGTLSGVEGWFESGDPLVGWVENSILFVAYIMVMPFYVASGFSLYIQRRVASEGWDIEITFRRLTRRIAAVTGTLERAS